MGAVVDPVASARPETGENVNVTCEGFGICSADVTRTHGHAAPRHKRTTVSYRIPTMRYAPRSGRTAACFLILFKRLHHQEQDASKIVNVLACTDPRVA